MISNLPKEELPCALPPVSPPPFPCSSSPPRRRCAREISPGSSAPSDGRPLPQIVLVLDGPSGSRTLVTGPDGRYRAQDLPPGDYPSRPDAPGFVVSPDARVAVADTEARLDLRLEPAPIREQVVVTATRGDAALSTLGVSVSVLDRERIAEREPSSVLQLLQDLPGIAVARTGGAGSQSSAFVRGGESRFARILVDGVPVNQPGGGFDFGSALPLELDRLEVVRGAASSLYGTDALAGVIHLVTRRAGPEPGVELRAEAEGGSFDWMPLPGRNLGALRRLGLERRPRRGWTRTTKRPTARSRRRRARRRWEWASASGRSCASCSAPRTASAAPPAPPRSAAPTSTPSSSART